MKNINHVIADCLQSHFEFPPGFCLQDGVYGGLVLAVATARIEAQAAHPIRSLQLNFCALARANLPTRCEVEQMRKGTKTETYAVSLYQGDVCVAHGCAFTGRSRASMDDALFLKCPDVAPVERVPVIDPGLPLPPYTQHFAMQPCIGDMILSGTHPVSGGYLSFTDPAVSHYQSAHLGALIDAWWPSFFVTATKMRPMATTSIQVNYTSADEPMASEPVLLEVKGQVVSGGFGSEINLLWSQDGRLLASAHQCIAIIA